MQLLYFTWCTYKNTCIIDYLIIWYTIVVLDIVYTTKTQEKQFVRLNCSQEWFLFEIKTNENTYGCLLLGITPPL